MKLLRNLHLFPEKRRTGFILAAYMLLISASIISGGVFLWLNDGPVSILTLIIISELTGLVLISIPILIMVYRYSRPREELKQGIKNIGEGCFGGRINPDMEKMYSDIAESINEAGQKLTDKMQSIIANTNRLSAVEEELSTCFKTDNCCDSHTKALIYQLRICTSRLRNDLNEFSLEKPNQTTSENRVEKSVHSSISV